MSGKFSHFHTLSKRSRRRNVSQATPREGPQADPGRSAQRAAAPGIAGSGALGIASYQKVQALQSSCRSKRLALYSSRLAGAPSCPPSGVSLSRGGAASPDGIAWAAFDPAAIARERAAGRPVFVEFTADWCITCKVNETVVLSRDAVREELTRWGYASFKADWTTRDDAITLELAEWGRAGVPMYLVYPADRGKEPEILPELLTLDATLEVLREAGRDKGA